MVNASGSGSSVSDIWHQHLTLRDIFVLFQFTLYISNSLTWQLHFQFEDTSSEYLRQVQFQGHGSKAKVTAASGSVQLKNYQSKIARLGWNICY